MVNNHIYTRTCNCLETVSSYRVGMGIKRPVYDNLYDRGEFCCNGLHMHVQGEKSCLSEWIGWQSGRVI